MTIFFFIIAVLMVASAVAVVTFNNPLQSALSLIAHLILVACMYAMLDAHFLSAVQITVYAGAIMVLVLFVVMLLNLKVEQPKPIGLLYLGIGIAAALGFAVIMIPVLATVFTAVTDPIAPLNGTARDIGRLLYTQYLFPFEIASVLIFVAIVGAVMIAKRNHAVVEQIADQDTKAGGVQ
jgi:NADH-quinone oxidoreductase subunit J